MAFAILVIITRAVSFYMVVFAASHSLHSKMLTAILRAPILFFDTNPVGELSLETINMLLILINVGRVLNRFSKDVGFLDTLLTYQSVEYVTVSDK